MARYTKMNPNAFKNMTWDAGIIASDFDPETGELDVENILWETTGTNSFSATRDITDAGEEINNCPTGTKQLQRANSWVAQATGTAVSVTAESVVRILGNADIDGSDATHIKPRNDILLTDFKDLWIITNYSEHNGETKGGYYAIHLKDTFSVDGLASDFDKNANGQFPYTLQAYYDMSDIDNVPFDIYVKAGAAESAG